MPRFPRGVRLWPYALAALVAAGLLAACARTGAMRV